MEPEQNRTTRATLDPLLSDADLPDAAFEANWRRAYRRRLLIVGVVLTVWTASIEARLAYLQIVRHPAYLAKATDQQTAVVSLPAKRGEILDRNGEVLATSVDVDNVIASPRAVADDAGTVDALCEAFANCTQEERTRLTATLATNQGRGSAYATIRRAVSPAIARRVAALELPGVWLESETKRFYPKRELAAHVLGFVGRDHRGLGGVENAFDGQIRGKDGRALRLNDALQRSYESHVELAPTAGASLELTIDQTIQFFTERELRTAVEQHQATAGTAIVMDVSTGDILALANYPTFDPNTPGSVSNAQWLNRAVQEVYEPGSTFKIVTAAAALEEGVLSPSSLIDTSPGVIRVGRVRTVEDTHPHGVLTFEDVIVLSSNVGAIKAGWQIGAERLNRYVHRFGFGEVRAPDFRGVSGGKVWRPELLDDSALASVSMGYQVSVTPLQMVTAASAVANGGTLFQPRIVRAVIRDGRRELVTPAPSRRAISAQTAATLTAIMEQVVDRGTGKQAQVSGYRVAGKTGTAQKIIDRQYSKTDHTGSFVGFVPAGNPSFAILVVIDQPRIGGYYGGTVAGPAFQRIAEASLRHLGVPSTSNPAPPIVVTTDATLMRRTIRDASPAPVRQVVSFSAVMPDVVGLGARDATRVLTRAGLAVRVSGRGRVISQSPDVGTPVESGDTGVIELGRVPAVRLTASGGGGGQ